ncbi:hypothetical protein AA103196_2300 [Ameyamaea chiangmaiensis NBRC 103196]|uniref:Uncharacterized protein n=1 Tax=Ameyamaea chiangmaiensis TaxID=442969 RepID=A0A850P2Y3_9PROT|nr:hypothetical protein [Ameyamaea chiangmaiensis]MBS4075440.1 hypothetical protein [Ameyamaea chiangmaiensis]NVN39027.1 hypothetical protein [Ameyamaea chiangmaiensis]GBQ69752.1 hypothetical protein AA103196_2300 [Ameyamaea chiangmaiensis NBRC 103196]
MSESAIIRQFSQLVAVAEDGQLNDDLDQEVTDLVAILNDAAASRNGKAKGSITLKVDFALDGGIITISTDYAVKKPKVARARSAFWATPDNKLSRRNPKQHELPLRDVSTSSNELRSL